MKNQITTKRISYTQQAQKNAYAPNLQFKVESVIKTIPYFDNNMFKNAQKGYNHDNTL